MNSDSNCPYQKKNLGIYCGHSTYDHCDHCGWNPEVAERRIEKLKEEKEDGK
jgi:hypothetical protein